MRLILPDSYYIRIFFLYPILELTFRVNKLYIKLIPPYKIGLNHSILYKFNKLEGILLNGGFVKPNKLYKYIIPTLGINCFSKKPPL